MRKNHPYLKIITLTLILAFTLCLTTCGEESGELAGFVWIPHGTFWMGSPDGSGGTVAEPNRGTGTREFQHQVTLTKGFYMSKYQITQEQFYAIMGKGQTNYRPESRRPAEGISWYEAIVFCNKLSIRNGLNPVYRIPGYNNSTDPEYWMERVRDEGILGGIPTFDNSSLMISIRDIWDAVEMIDWPNVPNGYRLPTEAEWEYACRGNYPEKETEKNTMPFGIGDGTKMLPGMANFYTQFTYDLSNVPAGHNDEGYGSEAADLSIGESTTVGSYRPNDYGLYDMHGNVREWCWDWYAIDYYTKPEASDPDPPGPVTGTDRVLRGGCWGSDAQYLRSAYRIGSPPSHSNDAWGFRLVRR